MACGGHAMSGMIKAQIECLTLEALINSGKLLEEDIVAACEVLEEAEAEFVAKQGPVDLKIEGMKADRNLEAEIRRITAEGNLIKLKMMAEQEEREKEHDMQGKWKQDGKKERQIKKQKRGKKPERSQNMQVKWKQEKLNDEKKEREDRKKKRDDRKKRRDGRKKKR
ncbi:uncharacterized protein [Palaemon carinicauda]|uniref:uncharacterized protein n=1 Tax=Palaemon carinicauda TaxID=392227 RepID=UPI0035B613F2